MPKPPDYGIIYNWDSAPHSYSEYPQTIEAFLQKTYAPMEDTQVGAHFWSLGSHVARCRSEVLEFAGDIEGGKYASAGSFTSTENLMAMLDRGEDPHPALIARGHELGLHVYASIRMNDNHFGGAQIEDMPTMSHGSLTQMRRDHPEWLLGDQTTEWFALSWNMAVPEIREHRYAHLEEVCRLYDWDGVELDWQRHSFHLPEDHGYRLRYVITDLQRAIRRMTNELSAARGRPLYLAARVAGGLEMCRRIGYDIPAWIEEDLVDILIPAGGAATDPSSDVEGFVELCRGTDVAVYPGLDSGVPGTADGPEDGHTKDKMLNRAIASRFHSGGADGVYVFNWHANRETRRELLTEMGTPRTLRRKDKIYAATHRHLVRQGDWRGAYANDRLWGEVPLALKRTLTGDGPTITLDIADDVAADDPQDIELRLRLDDWVTGDVVRVLWDGVECDDLRVTYDMAHDRYANPFASPVSDVTGAAWLRSRLSPSDVGKGAHTVRAVLAARHPKLDCDMTLTDVEVVIRYG